MITLYRAAYQTEPRAPRFCGTSAEEKPTTIANTDKPLQNGAYFLEVDTGNTYRFDAENSVWYLQP